MSDFDHDFDGRMDALFRSARQDTEAAPGDEARVRRALAPRLAASLVVASAATAHASVQAGARATGVAAKSIHVALLAKVAPIGLAAAVGIWGAAAHVQRQHASMPNTLSVAGAHTTSPHPGTASLAAEVAPAPIAPPISTPAAATAKPSTVARREPLASPAPRKTESTLADEVMLVARMHESWRAGDLASVDRLVDEHRRRFAHGILEEEREAMRAMRACLHVERGSRIEIARAFSEQHPSSPHVARVLAACDEETR